MPLTSLEDDKRGESQVFRVATANDELPLNGSNGPFDSPNVSLSARAEQRLP